MNVLRCASTVLDQYGVQVGCRDLFHCVGVTAVCDVCVLARCGGCMCVCVSNTAFIRLAFVEDSLLL